MLAFPASPADIEIAEGVFPGRNVGSSGEFMTVAELIYEQVKNLPENAAREVLDFVGYLRERSNRSDWRDLMNAQSASLAPVWNSVEDQVWDDV
jgi:hypothetical protein